MDEKLERIKEIIAEGSIDDKFELAEELIAENRPAQAQSVLDSINERGAKWHFLQSKVFFAKNWIYESRKQMEIAVQLEPDNAQYIEGLEKLKALGDAAPHSEESSKPEMAKKSRCREGCGEACCFGCGECLCQGLCEAICNGCN